MGSGNVAVAVHANFKDYFFAKLLNLHILNILRSNDLSNQNLQYDQI